MISGLGRSLGEGNGYPLHYSGLEISMECIVHGVTESQTRLSNFHLLPLLISLNFKKNYMVEKDSNLGCFTTVTVFLKVGFVELLFGC